MRPSLEDPGQCNEASTVLRHDNLAVGKDTVLLEEPGVETAVPAAAVWVAQEAASAPVALVKTMRTSKVATVERGAVKRCALSVWATAALAAPQNSAPQTRPLQTPQSTQAHPLCEVGCPHVTCTTSVGDGQGPLVVGRPRRHGTVLPCGNRAVDIVGLPCVAIATEARQRGIGR